MPSSLGPAGLAGALRRLASAAVPIFLGSRAEQNVACHALLRNGVRTCFTRKLVRLASTRAG